MYEYFHEDEGVYKIFYTQSEIDLIEYTKFRVHNTSPHINIQHALTIEMGDRLQTVYHNAYENYNKLTTFIANEQNIRYIGNEAFKNCELLNKIDFSKNNIGYIGNSAFENCFSLSECKVKNIKDIKANCFKNCTKLNTFTVLNNIYKIHDDAFNNCSELKTIKVVGILEIIGRSSFTNCTLLTDIEFNSTRLINDYAFYGCTSIQNVNIYSNNVEYIGKHAFQNCSLLKSIYIYGNVLRIGRKAFYNCYNLTNINIEGNLENVDNLAFYCDYNVYKNIKLENIAIKTKQDIKNVIETNLEIGRKFIKSKQTSYTEPYSDVSKFYNWSYNNEINIENYLHTYNGGIYTFYSDVPEYTYFRKFSEVVMNKMSENSNYFDKLYKIILKNKFKFIEFDTSVGVVSNNIIICEQPIENICFKKFKCVSATFEKNITHILSDCFYTLTNDLSLYVNEHVDTIHTKAFVNNKNITVKINSINTFETFCFKNNDNVSNKIVLHTNTIANKFPSDMIVDFSSVEIYVNNYTHDIPSRFADNGYALGGVFKCTIMGPNNDMIINSYAFKFSNIYLDANKNLKIKTKAFYGQSFEDVNKVELYVNSINEIEKSAFCAKTVDIYCKDIFSCGSGIIESSDDYIFYKVNNTKIYSNAINQFKSYTFHTCSDITIYCDVINSIPEHTFYDCSAITIYCKGTINFINSNAFTNIDTVKIFCDSILNFQEKIFVDCKNIKLYCIQNLNLNGILNENTLNVVNIEFNAGIKNIDLFLNKNRKIMKNMNAVIHDYTTNTIDKGFVELFANIVSIEIIFYESIYIEDEAFKLIDCTESINLIFKKDVIQIGEKAFESINVPFEILIEGNCYKIQNQAFFNSSITKFEVNLDIIHIGDEVFKGCASLKHVNVRNISYIGNDILFDCSNCEITAKNILYTNTIDLSDNIQLRLKGFIFHEKYDITNVIQNSANNVIPFYKRINSLGMAEYIQNGLINSFNTINSILKINGDLDYIEDYALSNSEIQEFSITGNIKYIGKHAFDNCIKLTTCTFQNVDDIGEYAFNNCKSIQSLKFVNVKRIHKYAFNNSCLSAPDIVITIANVEDYIDCYILNNVSNVSNVSIPNFEISGNINTIHNFAFSNCNVNIILNSINYFQQYAFQNDSVDVSLNITNIQDFTNLKGTDTLTIDELLNNKCTLNVVGDIRGMNSNELEDDSLIDFVIYLLESNNREYKINNLKNELNNSKLNLDELLSNDFGEFQDDRLFNYLMQYPHIIQFKFSLTDNNHTMRLNETYVPYITNINASHIKTDKKLENIYSSLNSIKLSAYEADSNLIKHVKNIEISENIISSSIKIDNFPLDASKNLIVVNNKQISKLPQTESNTIDYTGYIRFLNRDMLSDKAHINEFKFTGNIGTINENTFEYFEKMITVYIQGDVEEILSNAFKNCIRLKSFEITGNIKSIHHNVFNNCLNLDVFKIGGNVQIIYPLAFNNCYNLETVHIYGNVNILHNYSLHFNKSYEYNNQIVAITSNKDTYQKASNIFETEFLNNNSDTKDTIISKYMNGEMFEFNGYSKLDLRVINTVNYSFNGKTEIYNEDTVIGIHKTILKLDISGAGIKLNLSNLNITTLNVYGTIEDISGINCNITNWNMYGCVANISSISNFNIENLNIYGIVDTIQAEQGFINCKITSFYINGSINKLGIKTFVQTVIDKFEIIGYVNSIVDSSGNEQDDLSNPYVEQDVMQFSKLNDFYFDINTNWNNTGSFQNVLSYIGDIFDSFTNINIQKIKIITENVDKTNFQINGNIYKIESYAFENLQTLYKFEISGNIYKIESYAFYNCSKLSQFIIHGCVYEIEQNAFYGCYSLETFTIGYCIHSIGYRAFDTFVKQFTIQTPVIHDISECFVQNYNLTPKLDVSIIYNSDYPDVYKFKSVDTKIIEVGSKYTLLYYTPSNIKYVYISQDIDVIKSKVFQNIYLHDFSANNIQEIEHYAFMNSTINRFLCKDVKYIHYYAFRDCSLNFITISDIECIHTNAFDSCLYLSDFSCNNVKYIDKKAFIGCTNLTNFSINNIFYTPEKLYMYSSVFIDCTNLSSIVVNKPLILETNHEEILKLYISHNENIIIDKNTFERQFIESIDIISNKLVLIKENAFQHIQLNQIKITCDKLYIESSINYDTHNFTFNNQIITPEFGNLM